MKRYIFTRVLITILIFFISAYILYSMEYFERIFYVDNIIGIMPVIIIAALCGMGTALVWKRHKGALTSTIVLSVLICIGVLLFIPAYNGNWYPVLVKAVTSNKANAGENLETEKLPVPSETVITGDMPKLDGATALYPLYTSFAEAVYENADEYVICTNTSNAYESIIAKESDIIFVAGPSKKQMEKAESEGAGLVFTPIGKEAFVFIVGKSNPINGLTYQQIRDIYSGKTAKWKTLGWESGGNIIAFQRPEGSGSQTGLQNVMAGLPIFKPRPLPDESLAGNGRMMEQVSVEWDGVQPAIGYSYRYYATKMYPNAEAKLLSVDGVYPCEKTIANDEYIFSSEFYAVTNGEPQGNVKKFIDWILSEEGQYLVEKTGYVPLITK